MNVAVVDFAPYSRSALPEEPISRAEALIAQRAWADMVIEIGEVYLSGGDYRGQAALLIQDIYDFQKGDALLKPAFASARPVRDTAEEALSYYVGGVVWEDRGFALKPWRKIRFGKQRMSFGMGTVTMMGTAHLTPARSAMETSLDFTMGFRRDSRGRLRLKLHHSSLPYAPSRPQGAVA